MEKVKVFSDIYKLSRAAAEFFVTTSKKAIRERGRFSVALSGGATPESFYALLGTEPYSSRVNWDYTHIFWSDERCVPPKHIESNYRMARYAFLSGVPIPAENIHRIQGEIKPVEAAALYETQMRQFFGAEAEFPPFDMIFLGLGSDGHTASLFPNSEALEEKTRWAVATYIEHLNSWRITLTPPAINAAMNQVFIVSGSAKAARLQEVRTGEYDPQRLPAQLIRPTEGNLVWLVDHDAAELLNPADAEEQ